MEYNISKKVEQLSPSGIRAFFDLVLGMKDVISLGVGEPDFMTPWHIRQHAMQALEHGSTSYTSNQGLMDLRKEISIFLNKRYSLSYDPVDDVLVTVGVSEGLDLAARAIINPGDQVIIHQPSYVSYGPVVDLAGGEPIFIATEAKDQFKLLPKQIEKAVTKKTKALLINYPCNPTGASYTKAELSQIAKIVEKHNLLIISDEVYDELTYDFEHTPLATLPGMKERTIYLNGFSKAYAMTGFRIGYACGPKKIIQAMNKIHQYTMLCAPINGQMAAVEALRNGHPSVQQMKKEYDRRRRYIVSALNEIGLECHMPQGAFYVFPSIKKTGLSSMDFAKGLLDKSKVALVPGVAFGPMAEGHVRISYASSYEHLKEAIKRIGEFVNTSKKKK